MNNFSLAPNLVNEICSEMGQNNPLTEGMLRLAAFMLPYIGKHSDYVLIQAMTKLMVDAGFDRNCDLIVSKLVSILKKHN